MPKLHTVLVVLDVIGYTGYWGMGETISEARKSFKKHSGKFPSPAKAIWRLVVDSESLPRVDDMGSIIYSKGARIIEL